MAYWRSGIIRLHMVVVVGIVIYAAPGGSLALATAFSALGVFCMFAPHCIVRVSEAQLLQRSRGREAIKMGVAIFGIGVLFATSGFFLEELADFRMCGLIIAIGVLSISILIHFVGGGRDGSEDHG